MKERIKQIFNQIKKRFDSTGEGIFAIAHLGDFSGQVLSESVAILVDSTGEKLFVTHPSLLTGDSSQGPLISVGVNENILVSKLHPDAWDYPEITEIFFDELCEDDDD
jgi:hypothetical protein